MSTPPVVPEPVALPKPTPQQVRTAPPVVRALPPQEREPVVLPTLAPARLPPTQAVIVARPVVHTVPIEPLIASDPTQDPTLLPPTATYAGSHSFYLTDAGVQGDVSRWATFPAVTTVDLSGNALVGASDISTTRLAVSARLTAGEAGISTFLDVGTRTTTQDLTVNSGTILLVDPSGSQVLQAVGTDLFYDGQRLARAGEIPNLADWATFPAVQDVDVSGNSLLLVKELTDVTGAFGTAGQVLSSTGTQITWTDLSAVTSLNGQTGAIDISSGNAALTVDATVPGTILLTVTPQAQPVTSLNGQVGAIDISSGNANLIVDATVPGTILLTVPDTAQPVTSLNTEVGDIVITSANANLTVGSTGPGNILLTVPDTAQPVTSLNTEVGDIVITSANANLTVGSTGPGNILLTVPSPAASVTSVNGATGAVTVAGSTGVTASTVGQIVTLSAPGIATAQSAADAAQATANTALADAATAEATAVAAGASAATADATAVAAGVAAASAQATASTALAQSGVTAVNSGTGAITVAAGTGISVGTVGSTITVSATATTAPFSYNIYVSNVTGSDVTGTGLITNPYKTIGTAMTAANAIADSNPVILCLAPGTYAENVNMTRDNVYIVGGSTSLSTATNIAGTVTVDMTGSAQTVIVGGLSSVQITNIVYTNTVARNQSFILTDCLIVPGLGVSAISATDTSVGGNGDMTIQNSLIYMSDTVAVVNSNCSLNFINTQITNNPLVTSPATFITTTGTGRISLFGCSVIQTSTSTTVQPLINIGNTASSQAFSFNNAILQYTSAAVDAGTSKCCIRLSNSAAISSVSIINSLLICEGARVTNGIPTQYLAIQRTGAGTVTLNYGQNLCGATANHLPGAAVGLTKTPYIVLGN